MRLHTPRRQSHIDSVAWQYIHIIYLQHFRFHNYVTFQYFTIANQRCRWAAMHKLISNRIWYVFEAETKCVCYFLFVSPCLVPLLFLTAYQTPQYPQLSLPIPRFLSFSSGKLSQLTARRSPFNWFSAKSIATRLNKYMMITHRVIDHIDRAEE